MIDFSYFWDKAFIEVDQMVVGSGWRDMAGCFFREHAREFFISLWQGDLVSVGGLG